VPLLSHPGTPSPSGSMVLGGSPPQPTLQPGVSGHFAQQHPASALPFSHGRRAPAHPLGRRPLRLPPLGTPRRSTPIRDTTPFSTFCAQPWRLSVCSSPLLGRRAPYAGSPLQRSPFKHGDSSFSSPLFSCACAPGTPSSLPGRAVAPLHGCRDANPHGRRAPLLVPSWSSTPSTSRSHVDSLRVAPSACLT
jgi:hypothetical protein